MFRPEAPLTLAANKRYRITVEEIEPSEPDTIGDAWDVLESMIGKYAGPSDWSAEHDHYLYGTPKRYTNQTETE